MEKTEQLTGILKRLNAGEDPDQVKAEAMEFLATVGPDGLAIAEQNLLDAGLSVEDLHGLCPLHLEVLGDPPRADACQIAQGPRGLHACP